MAILHIDDEENALDTTSRLLALEGYEVVTATSSLEGLQILREGKTNITGVICDGVPKRDAVEEFCHGKNIRFCLHSADETETLYPTSDVIPKGQKETRKGLFDFCQRCESGEGGDQFAV